LAVATGYPYGGAAGLEVMVLHGSDNLQRLIHALHIWRTQNNKIEKAFGEDTETENLTSTCNIM
jgi:hypothetical protein